MLSTAKEIAEYFRSSVSFDFSKDISSYSQIANLDGFYTLTDKDAFKALLNDCLSYDNKLVDIFCDLYDAECGIQKFAMKTHRTRARMIIGHFLSDGKYSYHRTETAKVYLAINTWLLFFGAEPISTQWEKCPFCGSAMSNGVCTSKSCKLTAQNATDAIPELLAMLTAERQGKKAVNYTHWDKIKPDSEFYIEYKQEICSIRDKRDREKKEHEEKLKQTKLEAAEAFIAAMYVKAQLEEGKDNPDFESILGEIAESKEIKAVIKFKDGAVNDKLDNLKKSITRQKAAHADRVRAEEDRKDFDGLLGEFFKEVTEIENQFESPTLSVETLKTLLARADEHYAKITSQKKRGGYALSASDEKLLNKYAKELKDKFAEYVNGREHYEMLSSLQQDLIKAANALEFSLKKVTPSQNKAASLRERFNKQIAANDAFNIYRKERAAQYREIVQPLADILADLTAKEDEYKIKKFSAELSALNAEIDKADLKEGKSADFASRFKSITADKFYSSISGVQEFTAAVAKTQRKIDDLKREETDYARNLTLKRKKRKFKGIFISVAIAVFILLAAVGIFIGELAGVFPKIVLAPVFKGVSGKNSQTGLVITGVNDDRSVLEIPEKARVGWQLTEKTVTRIEGESFKGNSNLQTVILPKTVVSIGAQAFYECTNLESLVISSPTPPALGESVFGRATKLSVYVSPEVYSAFINDKAWSEYEEYIFPYYANSDDKVTVLFDYCGGEPNGNYKLTEDLNGVPSLEKGSALSAYTCRKFGYTFGGWASADGKTVNSADKNLKLKAVWASVTSTVHFEYNGATGGNEDAYTFATYGLPVGTLPLPVRTGYTFEGWFDNEKFEGARYTEKTVFNEENDISLYARWTVNKYTITFDYQGAGNKYQREVTYDGAIGSVLNESVEKSGGNTFGGWWTAEGGGGERYTGDTIYKVDGDITLYAKWETEIILDLQGGSADGDTVMPVVYNAILTGLPEAARAGYVFDGWWTAEGGGGREITNNEKFTEGGRTKLYAKWKTTVYFETHGGSLSIMGKEVVYNRPVGELPEPFKNNTTFGGWFSSTDYITQFTAETPYLEDGGITLHARWLVSLIFDYGGATENCSTEFIYVLDGRVIGGGVLPEPLKTGHKFGGWFEEKDGGGKQFTASTVFYGEENIVIYARWIIENYKVVFDPNGGSAVEDLYVSFGQTIDELSESVLEGNCFTGWYLDGGGKLTAGEAGDLGDYTGDNTEEPITVNAYAQWALEQYTITFNTDGSKTAPIAVNYGEEVISLPISSKSGHYFNGWYFAEDEDGTRFSEGIIGDLGDYPDGDIQAEIRVDVYAHWVLEKYNINFDSNGGNEVDSIDGVYYGGRLENLPYPEKYGYVFTGWYLSTDNVSGFGTRLYEGELRIDLGDYSSSELLPIQAYVYAGWVKVTVTYYGSGTSYDPYRIYEVYQLRDLAEQVNGGNNFADKFFSLEKDILNIGDWTPIGNNNHEAYYSSSSAAVSRRFAGNFNGNSFTIGGYSVSSLTEKYADTYSGLFGYLASGAVIEYLNVAEVYVNGYSTRFSGSKGGAHHGAIAGLSSGTIRNCTVVSGIVTGTATLDTHHGGIVGYTYLTGAAITDCVNNADVDGVAGRCNSHGGIVGSVNNGVVYGCKNNGRVIGTNNKTSSYSNGVKGYVFLGGIAGVSCAVIMKCECGKDLVAGGGWSYNGISNSGSGAIVGYLHNGSDMNTASTGDDTLEINKEQYGDKYYSAVISCTAQNTRVGFVQNDSGNDKRPIAITSDTDYRSLCGTAPTKISSDYYDSYLNNESAVRAVFATCALTVPSDYIENSKVSEGQTGVWDQSYYELPKNTSASIMLAGGCAFGVVGAIIIAVIIIKTRKKKGRK